MQRLMQAATGLRAAARPPALSSDWATWARGRRRILQAAAGLATIVSLGGTGLLWAWPVGEPERLGVIEGDALRGAYLARASGCVACHTAPGGQALAGGAPLDTPFGTFVPPNITPSPTGGIGGWTLDEFATAVRQGVAPEGHAYYPAFTYEFYAGLSDQDVADLFAAIQTVPPVVEPAPAHDVGFPFNLRMGLKLWRAAFLSQPYVTPVMGRSELWNRGQELVTGPSHCAACHTGRNLLGGLQAGEAFAGSDALPDGGVAPSIRRDDLLARGWTPENLTYSLRTGIAPDGDALGGSMAEAIHQGTSYLDEADREAIAAYILDVDQVGGSETPAAEATETAPMGGMEGMEGMDHASMMAAPDAAGATSPDEAAVSAVTAIQRTSATGGMAGMDHSAMDMAPPEADGSPEASDQGATSARPRVRPRPRPGSQ